MVAEPYEEIHYIEDTIGNQQGTVFVTQIGRHNINTLFDTGATRSVMSVEMYNKLDNPAMIENRTTQGSECLWLQPWSRWQNMMQSSIEPQGNRTRIFSLRIFEKTFNFRH